jgi:hypothetical protein
MAAVPALTQNGSGAKISAEKERCHRGADHGGSTSTHSKWFRREDFGWERALPSWCGPWQQYQHSLKMVQARRFRLEKSVTTLLGLWSSTWEYLQCQPCQGQSR